ncbi:MAG: peptide chain release factor N(5)-glutamine methyltransferase [Candidatus Melainabacteria bacterium]|nr:peptide chain release factor N(5)-glutamine methyltransferase [Candidatus Melainabacteria bacterium]
MKTLGEVLTLTVDFLKDKKVARHRRVAEELIGHALKLKRMDIYMQFDRPMAETELESLRALLKRAVKGEPVEYIIGHVQFYHCQIAVNPDVLIPRPETELLVDQACRQLTESKTVWDICTGSGYIAIALKKAHPHLTVVASDISEKALELAKANAAMNEVEVELLLGDLLAPFAGRKADAVLCNPPYISSKEYLTLDRSVLDFEPKGALVGGEDGLEFYRRLEKDLPAYLNPQAKIFFEIGTGQGNALLSLFSGGRWKGGRVEKDWAGHDRFFFLEFE